MSGGATMPCPMCMGSGDDEIRGCECRTCDGTGEISKFVRIEDPWYQRSAPDVNEQRMQEIRDMDIESWAADQYDPGVTLGDAVSAAADAHAERMEQELRGAWRAGYDYLHVYEAGGPQSTDAVRDYEFTIRQYVLPSDTEYPPRPDGRIYLHTYDLTAVPDHVIRAAIRGELDGYERLSPDR